MNTGATAQVSGQITVCRLALYSGAPVHDAIAITLLRGSV